MTFFDVISMVGGIAIFLYGMSIMGSGLEKMVGGKTEAILRKLTSSTWKGVVLGALITALIQSSAGTTVIVIGLVNSGILQFSQGIGVVMGANIGTTVTAQIIRLSDISGESFALQLLKPTSLAPMLVFAGVILFLFLKNQKRRNFGQIMLGLGLLFYGMTTMETAVAPLRDSEVFVNAFASLQNPFLGVLAGALVTAALQSSSASVGILQALTATGAVRWGAAIPIILGQNIGTCVTALIASVGASRGAKRVAFSHLYFNVIGTGVCLALIYGYRALFGAPFWDAQMNMGDVANFHTLFNVATTMFFIPFSGILVRLVTWTVPEQKGEAHPELAPVVLDARLYASPSVAIGQARKAVEQMAEVGRMNQRNAVEILLLHNGEDIQLAEQREDVVDKLDVAVTNYLVDMTELELSEAESRDVTMLLNFVTEFERIGDYAINVVERSGEVFDKEIRFSESARRELHVLSDAVGEIFDLTIAAFSHNDMEEAAKVEPLEETVDMICETLRERHIRRLKEGSCNIEAGIIFLEVLTDYERISDHCSNVAARLLSLDEDEMDMHTLRRSLHAGSETRYDQAVKRYQEKYVALLDDAQGESCVAPAAQPLIEG